MAKLLESLDPWLEKEAYNAIVYSKQAPETKFVQVLQRLPLLLLSDKMAHIVCHCGILPKEIQVGSLVKLSQYQFTVDTNEDIEARCSIQLQTDTIHLVGAQGMGIVGDPVDIHDTIQVRRAMDSINSDSKALMERLSATIAIEPTAAARKAGNPLALLENQKMLAQLMGEDDNEDDDDSDKEQSETQGLPTTQQFDSPRGKWFKKAYTKGLGNPLALLDDDDKLDRIMGAAEDSTDEEEKKDADGSDIATAKMGDSAALLADDSELKEIMSDDDNHDDNSDTGPETQAVTRRSPAENQGKHQVPLKESLCAVKKSKPRWDRPRSFSNISVLPFSDGGEDNTELQHQFQAVAEEARDKRHDDDEVSSASSDPIGISDVLLPPAQQQDVATAPVATKPTKAPPVNKKRFLVPAASSAAKRGKGVRIKAPGNGVLSRQRPTFLSASSPRETSTETQPTTNRSVPSDQEYLRRFRKTRAFFDRIWEQRNNDEIKFTYL